MAPALRATLEAEAAQLRQALAASEARYRALYENNPVMFFTLSTAGTVLSVNRFGAAELGYEPRELVGQSVLKVFHPEDRPAVAEGLRAHLAREPGSVSRWEFRKVRASGETIWVREAVTTMKDANDRTVVLVVCDNITHWKSAERDLAASKERLAMMERMAALGTLVSGVAHEIRTPLTIIQANAHLLAGRARALVGEERARELRQHEAGVEEGVSRINGLVVALRRFTGPQATQPVRTCLETPVGEATRLFRGTHPAVKRIVTDLRRTPDVMVVPAQVEQVVIHLLQNAVDALAEGPRDGLVTIRTLPDESGGALLVVEDNGPGIPPDLQERVFDPLFTTRPDGSGLGLATVQGIVRRHRAHMRLRSVPGLTRFEIGFPPAPAE